MAVRAEIGVNAAATATYTFGGMNYLVQTPTGVLYSVLIDSASDVVYRKSSDNGLSWGAPVVVFSGTASGIALWYDEWSGVAGGLIHMVYIDNSTSDIMYRSLDVDSDTLGTQTTVIALTSLAGTTNALTIVRARGGNLIVVYDIDGGTEDGARKSTDVGGTWGAMADPTEGAADMYMLLPGWNADTQDVQLIFLDISADELSVKRYDDSGDSWAESAIGTVVENAQTNGFPHFAGAVDTTNSQNLVIAWNAVDAANQDLLGWTVTDSAITAFGTSIVANATDDCGFAAIGIDTLTQDWYAFYCGKSDGSETFQSAMNIYYKASTDDGATWGSETALTTAACETRYLDCVPRSIGFPMVRRDITGVGSGGMMTCVVPIRGAVARSQVGL